MEHSRRGHKHDSVTGGAHPPGEVDVVAVQQERFCVEAAERFEQISVHHHAATAGPACVA
jgi:hypothetical protein